MEIHELVQSVVLFPDLRSRGRCRVFLTNGNVRHEGFSVVNRWCVFCLCESAALTVRLLRFYQLLDLSHATIDE